MEIGMKLIIMVALIVWTGVGVCTIRTLMLCNEVMGPMRKLMKPMTKMYEKMYEDMHEEIEG